MGQNTKQSGGQIRQLYLAENLALPVAAPLTVLLELFVHGLDEIGIQLEPTVAAFTAFQIEGKFHPDAPYVVLYSSTATPAGLLVASSGELATLAAGGNGWVVVNTESLYALRIKATSATNSGFVDAYAGGSGQ